eukprot:710663_1
MAGGDYVFIPVYPGGNDSYIYNIPCSHTGGIHWYHAHHHPSVQLHVGGGAAGAIIIEDDANAEGLPDWYTNMRELIFFINHIDSHFFNYGYPDRTQAQKDNQLILKLIPNNKDLYIVNGEYQPTVCQTINEWIRYRFIQTEIRDPQRYKIGNNNDCILKLLARDGIIIQNPPRDVGNIVWLSEASRADVAIMCIEGIHSITAINDNFGDIIIAYIHVEGEPITPIELTPFQPIRPHYLRDLSTAPVANSISMQMFHDGIVINNGIKQKFGQHATPWFQGVNNFKINSVNEFTLTAQPIGIGYWHPLHMHINHFQIINGPPNNQLPVSWQQHLVPPIEYQQVGDFVDTLWGPGVVRFQVDLWGGPLLVHCHRLEHEVGGAMGSFIIEDGCDAMYNDFSATNTCTFDSNCAPTLEPTTGYPSMTPTSNPSIGTLNPSFQPTIEPTIKPTDFPSEIPTYIPTYEPTHRPTYIPTNIPTKTPSINPTVYPSITPSNNPSNIPSLYPTLLPSINPSITPTQYPSVFPTYNPSIEPTYIPTLYPTNEPTLLPTLYPTSRPTIQPTNNPTDWIPMYLTCGNEITGAYDNKIIYFQISLPYNGNLIFDASDSDFKMKALTAFEKDNINGGFVISTNKNILRINNLTIGDYFFSIEGRKDNYGIFNVIITCEELLNKEAIILLSTDVIMYAEIKSDNFIINHIVGIYAIIGVLSFGLCLLIVCNCFIYLRSKCKKEGRSKSGHMRVSTEISNIFGKNSINMNTPVDTNDINDYQEDEIINIVQELTAP